MSCANSKHLWLLNTLLQYKRLSFEEIQRKWEDSYLSEGKSLNLRTFHKYRTDLEEIFEVIISCDKSDGYKYYIEDTSFLRRDKARRWLLNSFAVANMVREGQSMHDRILLEEIPEGTEYLLTVIGAMKQKRELVLEYQSFSAQKPLVFHVQPYCMRVFHQRWYILGRCEEARALRQFALDRTRNLEIGDTAFEYPEDFSAEAFYAHFVGVDVEDQLSPEKVVLRVYGKQVSYFRTLPFHHSQREINATDTYADFEYRLCINSDLIRKLMENLNNIEVLQPVNLRKLMVQNALSILNRYKGRKS